MPQPNTLGTESRVDSFETEIKKRDQRRQSPVSDVEKPQFDSDGKPLSQAQKQVAREYNRKQWQMDLELVIQDAAERIKGYMQVIVGVHIFSRLELELFLTKAMISCSERDDKVYNVITKNIDPVVAVNLRYAIANSASFLVRSIWKDTNRFKDILKQQVEKLEEKIEAQKTVEDGASEVGRNDVEDDEVMTDS
ncbi:hypothetical protein DHEL01_v204065 [Diaporthe helianthi]|uniref:Uncharacterized protein n=1 Tax=Diaporthe helianthi TaxID=158607 RepID=A0A2P5I4T8_DIAHE|nr:hypothetical protein DHEL01_v204065 [Diaporthe helianthi]